MDEHKILVQGELKVLSNSIALMGRRVMLVCFNRIPFQDKINSKLNFASLSKDVFEQCHQPETDFLHSWVVFSPKFLGKSSV